MFSKDNIVQFVAGASCFSFVQMVLLFVLGGILTANKHYHELLGNQIRDVGGGLIFLGFLYPTTSAIGLYTARTQNKFLLLVQFVYLALLLFLQLLFGSISIGRSATNYTSDFQVRCLTIRYYNESVCQGFFQSTEYAGTSIVWQSYYTKSLHDPSYRTMLLSLQKENYCCGFGLPLHCENDTRSFPSGYPKPALYSTRRMCDSSGTDYYPSTKDCNRCMYDMPAGTCGSNPVMETSRGCGAFVFHNLSTQVFVVGVVVMSFLVFPIIFLIATLCLCLKRRDEDVLPSSFAGSKIHANG